MKRILILEEKDRNKITSNDKLFIESDIVIVYKGEKTVVIKNRYGRLPIQFENREGDVFYDFLFDPDTFNEYYFEEN